MIYKTDEEIEQFFKTHISDADIEINRDTRLIKISVSQMYEYVPNGFQELKKIGEFFGTDKVNGSDKDYYSGCETCDYGSSYTVNFIIEE